MSPFAELQRSDEKPVSNTIIFEHLYPGCKYNELRRLNLSYLVTTLLSWNGDFEDLNARFGRAFVCKEGFAERIELPKDLDRFTLSCLYHNVLPVQETTHPYLGDLLKRGERFGGIATQRIQWVSTTPGENAIIYGFFQHDPPDWMRKTATGKIIGVLNGNNHPSAYILYNEEQRFRRYVQESVPKSARVRLTTQGVTI